jgi:hypothetical protein
VAEGRDPSPWASDPRLEAALTDLGGRLRYPPEPGPNLLEAVTAAIEPAGPPVAFPRGPRLPGERAPRTQTGRGLVMAAAIVLVMAALAAATTFGVRGVRIVFGPAPRTIGAGGPSAPDRPTATPPGAGLFLGEPMSLARIRARLRFPLTVPTAPGLATPTAYLSQAVAAGAANLVYPAGPGLPAGVRDVGLIVTEFVGRVERPSLVKFAGPDTVIEDVDIDGAPGIWISGPPHRVAYLLPDGTVSTQTLRLSGGVLLWQRGEVTMRLESNLSKDRAIAIAASIR